jgi:hypothetical protein
MSPDALISNITRSAARHAGFGVDDDCHAPDAYCCYRPLAAKEGREMADGTENQAWRTDEKLRLSGSVM